tara:strand:- start:1070 stop:1651 length:582 start_codon:yes stop_codon:yes gene_type:complete
MFNIQDMIGKKLTVSKHLQQRGIADLIEGAVCDTIQMRHGGTPARSKRSIEDVMVGESTYVDIKTRDINAEFSMPNLISIERLRKLYSEPENELVLVFVDYSVSTKERSGPMYTQDTYATIESIEIRPIETIDWSCMHIQALGKGQLQLKNAANPVLLYRLSRLEWMKQLRAESLNFIDKQLSKLCKYRENWV